MNPHPRTINTRTTATFKITRILLINADSFVPFINSKDSKQIIKIAGKLTIPPSLSHGPCKSAVGISIPKLCKNLETYCDQLAATVAAPRAYSKTKSQPIIQAINSPIVA